MWHFSPSVRLCLIDLVYWNNTALCQKSVEFSINCYLSNY
uniref:Uncharacterized protein n=1 Tax=Anguilla anguilla TaxID=7936 RepID=A0A0E9X3D6_ANGAN